MAFSLLSLNQWRRGSVLVSTPDAIPDDALRRANNVRLDRVLGAITPRPGWTRKTFNALAGAIVSLTRLFTPVATYGYAQIGSTLYRASSTWETPTSITTSGTQRLTDVSSPDGVNHQWKYFTNVTVAVKDDGTTTSTMGIAPPTAAPTAVALATDLTTSIDQMDAAASWTGTNVSGLADDSAIFQETPSAVTFTVAASTFGSIAQYLGAAVDLDLLTSGDPLVKGDDYIHLWVRVDRPDRVVFLQLDIDIDSATTGVADAFRRNYYTVQLFAVDWLARGFDTWTRLQVRKNAFRREGNDTARTWAHARTFRIGVVTNAFGPVVIHVDDFKLRGGVGLEGTIEYTVCYRNSGTKARGNPPKNGDGVVLYTTPIVTDRQRINVTTTNVIQGGANHPGDTQIDTLMIWRKGSAFASAVLVDEIADTTASPFLDNVSDETLLLTSVLLETDNDRPPSADFTRVIFGPDGAGHYFLLVDGIRLYVSKAYEANENRVENWPADAYAFIGDGSLRGLAGCATASQTIVWTVADTYELQGFDADTLIPIRLEGSRGIVGTKAWAVGLDSVFFVSQDGIYQHRGRSQRKLTSAIDPFFEGRTIDGQETLNRGQFGQVELAFFNASTGGMLVMLYCAFGSSVLNRALVLKLDANGIPTEAFFDQSALTDARTLFLDDVNNELLVGAADGHVYSLEQPDVHSDHGTAIAWRARTKSMDGGHPSRQKYVAHAVIEGTTVNEALTVTAYYDRNASSEVLSSMQTTSSVAVSQHATSNPEARYRDVAIEVSGSTTSAVQITRMGAYVEAQPERVTFLDSGEVAFEFVQQLKYLLMDMNASANIDVRVYADGLLVDSTTVIATSERAVLPVPLRAGIRGRTFRVTYTASEAFLHYNTVGWFKPLGDVQGYQERQMIAGV